MQAEGHAMITGTDNGDKLRAAICSAYGNLDRQKWEESCAKQMIHLWLSDCNALVTHVLNPRDERLENTRLSLDLSMLKSRLWADPEGQTYEDLPDPKGKDFDKAQANNILRWIDTSAMIGMTKRMRPDVLIKTMTGHIDLTPTPESVLIKSKKKAGRAKAKAKDESLGEFQNDTDFHKPADAEAQDTTHSDTANFVVSGIRVHSSTSSSEPNRGSHHAPADVGVTTSETSESSPSSKRCRQKLHEIQRYKTVFGDK